MGSKSRRDDGAKGASKAAEGPDIPPSAKDNSSTSPISSCFTRNDGDNTRTSVRPSIPILQPEKEVVAYSIHKMQMQYDKL